MSADVVVIGSGIGGLCCAALLAKYGFDVVVCESHSIPGGAAHAFERNGFIFDSGPSLYSGLSARTSPNPLRHVLNLIGEDLPCLTYDAWGCWLPEGNFSAAVGAEPFCEVLANLRGPQAVAEWRALQTVMEPLGRAAVAVPPAALRSDLGAAFTLARYAPALFQQVTRLPQLTGPFSRIMDGVVRDPFVRNWLDLLCFMLSGLPASATVTAEMAFMFADWYRPDVVLDYPVGGSGALVNALLRGLQRRGGQLRRNAHVEQILVKNGRATGVQLRGGEEIIARKAVVSNAILWDTLKLLSPEVLPTRYRRRVDEMPECNSFMHLHLGINGAGLSPDLDCHHLVVNDWETGITAPQNVVAISIPSLIDPSLAPPGKHTVHVYTPATEPYSLWQTLGQDLDRRSEAYAQQKEQRSEVMWKALERMIPDIRTRCDVTLVGTPLTHARYLRRHRGTYGPAIAAGKALFPGPKTPLPGLLCCGDSTFPGIGLPAVAASGMIAAHVLAPVQQQMQALKEI